MGVEMEADRMVNALVRRQDLDTEMTVVRNEYENGENSPGNVLIKRLQSIAYDWHNYGNSTIGNRSDIENVKIENLQAFYRRYYQPDNAVLLVAGRFDEQKVKQWIAAAFGKIPKPKRELPKLWTVEPTQDGERSFVVRRKGDIQIVLAAYKLPSALHADSDAIGFINYVLTDAPPAACTRHWSDRQGRAGVGFRWPGRIRPCTCWARWSRRARRSSRCRPNCCARWKFQKNPPTAEEMGGPARALPMTPRRR
jgi:zinc protease